MVIGKILTSRLSLSKHLAHNLGNLLLLGKIGVFHNRRNASSRLLLLISKHLILCIYLVFRIMACSRRLNASNLFLSLILHLGNLFLIVQLHFSKLFLILKSGVNHTSRGSISTSTLPSIKLRKCSSKIITSILSFISGRLATKSNRSEERRVGKECRSRWSAYDEKKNDVAGPPHGCRAFLAASPRYSEPTVSTGPPRYLPPPGRCTPRAALGGGPCWPPLSIESPPRPQPRPAPQR